MRDKIFGNKFHLLISLFSLLFLTRFGIDPDLGWHLALGERALVGEIVRGDIFSWTLPEYEWGNRYFGYQAMLAFLWQNLGLVGTSLLFGVLASAAVAMLLPRKLTYWQFLTVVLGLSLVIANLGVRPHTISFIFLVILIKLLEKRIFLKEKWLMVWLVLFALWANFHYAFAVGLLILAIFMTIDGLWARERGLKAGWRARWMVLAVAVLGSLANPFHLMIGQSVIEEAVSGTWLVIAEWYPAALFMPLGILYAVSGVVFIFIFAKRFRSDCAAWFLTGAFLFLLSFLAVNFIFFWVAIFIFLAARFFDPRLKLAPILAFVPGYLALVALAIHLALVLGLEIFVSGDLSTRLIKEGYPVKAAAFLEREGLTVNVFNEYRWGGFLDWQARNVPVFIDGRMSGWRKQGGDYILADYMKIMGGDCQVMAKYPIKTILVKYQTNNSCFADFKLVYEDETSRVMVREKW